MERLCSPHGIWINKGCALVLLESIVWSDRHANKGKAVRRLCCLTYLSCFPFPSEIRTYITYVYLYLSLFIYLFICFLFMIHLTNKIYIISVSVCATVFVSVYVYVHVYVYVYVYLYISQP